MNLTNLLEPFQEILNDNAVEIETLTATNLSLHHSIDDLLQSLKEITLERNELLDQLEDLTAPEEPEDDITEDTLEYINTLFQEATDEPISEAKIPVIPVSNVIDSIIARTLVDMDRGKQARINTNEMLNLLSFKTSWENLKSK